MNDYEWMIWGVPYEFRNTQLQKYKRKKSGEEKNPTPTRSNHCQIHNDRCHPSAKSVSCPKTTSTATCVCRIALVGPTSSWIIENISLSYPSDGDWIIAIPSQPITANQIPLSHGSSWRTFWGSTSAIIGNKRSQSSTMVWTSLQATMIRGTMEDHGGM